MINAYRKENGAALFVALVFLVVITLISINAMRSSTLELKMASNEQEHAKAVQSAQSAIAAAIESDNIIATNDGDITCFNTPPTNSGITCDRGPYTLSGSGYDSKNFLAVEMIGTGSCPPGIANSVRGGSSVRATSGGTTSSGTCAYMTIDSKYDATATGGGLAEIVEGHVILLAN